MQVGHVWIVIGCLSAGLSGFSFWYGPHLLSKSSHKKLSPSEAKIKIGRILEDYSQKIEDSLEKSREEARKIDEEMNARGILRSGVTINFQLKRVSNFKKTGEMEEIELKRKLEDIAIKLGKSNISELWSFPELAEFKPKYEDAVLVVRGAVSGMLSEVNRMANSLGVPGNYSEENL